MGEGGLAERVWYGTSAGAGLARAALAPAAAVYGLAVRLRGTLYDHRLLRAHLGRLPAVSVGNLTVGGTGKTPVAAWLAGELAARGAHPAIVLRGYGNDEPLVHRRLQPALPVIATPDRLLGIARAADAGADIVVLDDAFQHRRVARVADVVLLSADRWTSSARLLPAGPWREPLGALRRASLALVTRKAVPPSRVDAVMDAVARVAPALPRAAVYLALGPLRRLDAVDVLPLESLAGRAVLCASAVGDPGALSAQLGAAGVRTETVVFPDHHAFTARDARRLAARAERGGEEDANGALVLCTLKDAVKLAPLWPRGAPPLWYVTQQLVVESGQAVLDALLARLEDARSRQQRGGPPAAGFRTT